MNHYLTPDNLNDYRAFLRIKQLPSYRIRGRMAWFPDEYADQVFGALQSLDVPGETEVLADRTWESIRGVSVTKGVLRGDYARAPDWEDELDGVTGVDIVIVEF